MALRPPSSGIPVGSRYVDLIGQQNVVARLKAFTEYFMLRGLAAGHILLIGDDGMGKSTIAGCIANECGVGFQIVDSVRLEAPGDFTAIVTNLREKQILEMQNVNLLRRFILEKLQSVVTEGQLVISIGQGHAARNHTMEVRPFTLIATCRKKSECPPSLLDKFSLVLELQPYSKMELAAIAERVAANSGITLEAGASALIARCCDGRPGHLDTVLRRLTNAIHKPAVSEDDLSQAFAAFGIEVRPDAAPSGFENLLKLSGRDFEQLISTLLLRMGFRTELTTTTGDGGIDVVAMLDRPIVGGKYLFQCKRYGLDNTIGSPMVRDFYGAVTADRAVKGIFITTSDFSPQAREFAEKVGVELINLRELRKLLAEHGLAQSETSTP